MTNTQSSKVSIAHTPDKTKRHPRGEDQSPSPNSKKRSPFYSKMDQPRKRTHKGMIPGPYSQPGIFEVPPWLHCSRTTSTSLCLGDITRILIIGMLSVSILSRKHPSSLATISRKLDHNIRKAPLKLAAKINGLVYTSHPTCKQSATKNSHVRLKT